jgi:DNA-binding MarR family transcriptional regulator
MDGEERKQVTDELATALRELMTASHAFEEALGQALGLNSTDLRCVELLERRGTMSAGALAELAGLSTGAITFLLDRLERAGFVSRVRDLNDRRRVLVELVPVARAQLSELHRSFVESLRSSAQRYPLSELERLVGLLHEGTQLYEAQLSRLFSQGAVPGAYPGTASGRATIKAAVKAQAKAEARQQLEKTARKLQAKANKLARRSSGL